MQNKKTRYSVCRVLLGKKVVGYLTQTMIENGLDIQLDMCGYTIEYI